MASRSTVPAAKRAILAMLVARPNLATVQTQWSDQGQYREKESIYMWPAQELSESVPTMRTRPHWHDESYVIPVYVDVLYEGNDAQAAEERMWDLVAEVEEPLRMSTDLGDPATFLKVQVAGKVPDEYASDLGRGVHCRINVAITGRS